MVFQTRAGFQLQEGSSSDASGPFASLDANKFRMRVASKHFSTMGPFASISSNLLNNLGSAGASPKSRVESHTAVEFPAELCHKSSPCAGLAGLGVRAKKLFGIKNINVYALGVYVDDAAAKKALGARYKSVSEEALSQDPKLFEDVINGSFEKSLRLVISFGSLRRAQFLDALQERLEPRLKEAGEPATLDTFKQQFDSVAFKKGTEIVFVQEGSKLITKVDGQTMGSISSQPLCKSMFDIYLGSDPVAPDAKSTFGKTLAAVLKQ